MKNNRWKPGKKGLLLLALEAAVLLFCLLQLRNSGTSYPLQMERIPDAEAQQILASEEAARQAGDPQESGNSTNTERQIPAYRSSKVTLTPGVYRVVMHYQASKDMDNAVTVTADGASYDALLTNQTTLYAGQDTTSYVFWITQKTDGLSLMVTQGEQNTLTVSDAAFVKTNHMERANLLVAALAFVLLDLLLYCLWVRRPENAASNQKRKENRIVFWGLAVTILLSCAPLYMDVMFSGADATFHLLRIEGIKDGLLSGQFPVRLEPNWLQGHGYASGFFYCDLFLYFPALLRLFGMTVQEAYKIYKVAVNAATVLVAYYSFSRMFRDRLIGLFGSAIYSFTLMRLVYIYAVDGVGQYTGMIFLPLICYGFWLLLTGDIHSKEYRRSWIPLTLGFTGIIESHVLTCELAVIFSLLLCLLCIRKVLRKQTFQALCKAALAAIALNLWYLVPMVDYMRSMDFFILKGGAAKKQIQTYGMYLTQLFEVFPRGAQYGSYPAEKGPIGETAYSIGLGLTIAFLLFLWLFLFHRERVQKMPAALRRVGGISWLLGSISLWMATVYFPWDALAEKNKLLQQLIATMQFPNRMLAISDVLFTVTACWCVAFFKVQTEIPVPFTAKRAAQAAAACMLAGTFLTASYYMDTTMSADSFFRIYDETCMGNGYISGGEYVLLGTDVTRLTYKPPVAGEGVTVTDYTKRYQNVSMTCSNAAAQESYVELPLLYYKGYQAKNEATGEALTVTDGDNHVVRVLLPAGFQGRVQLMFADLWYWRVSELISLAALIFLLVLARKRQSGILTGTDQNFSASENISETES